MLDHTPCAVADCDSPAREADYCWRHWARWQAFGDALASRRFYRHDDRLRLLALVREDAATNCWIWQGVKTHEGYGNASYQGRTQRAHRAMFQAFGGIIPDGLTLDHLCRNPSCVNPAHLEPVTIRENTHRGETIAAANLGKTHCPQGHEYTLENTYLTTRGSRRCRTCTREYIRASKAKKRAQSKR